MENSLFFLLAIALAVIAVVTALVFGLINLVAKDDPKRLRRSNKFMQFRIATQIIAVIVILVLALLVK